MGNYFNVKPRIDFDQDNIEKPFTLENRVVYTSNSYYGKVYKIKIDKGYKWDGATIPRFAWTLIGIAPTDPRVVEASMVHDKLCENKDLISSHGTSISTNIFADILSLQEGISKIQIGTMRACVRVYQTTQKGWKR